MTSFRTRASITSAGLGLLLVCAPARAQSRHPLDPLSGQEIERTVQILDEAGRLGLETRFALIDLHEPPKARVLEDLQRGTVRRASRAMLYDWATRTASEAIVDLGSGEVVSWSDQEDDEPPIRRLVIARLNEIVKDDPEWQEAVSRFGVTDYSRVNLLARVQEDTRLEIVDGEQVVEAFAFMMDERPEAMILPVSVRVNLTRGEVTSVDVEAAGSWEPSNRSAPNWGREPLTPLEIRQPEGTSYEIDGSEVRWQNWRFHYGVHPRRGLELYDVRYTDRGEERSILYRAAVSETLTPYGDPEGQVWYPIDEGDYGFGIHGIRSAVPGGDAPPNAVFRDAVLHDHRGQPYTVPRAVTFYERDGGVLWRHAEESIRSRELVVSYMSAIDNYDYVFNWVFRQDGTLDVNVQLSGVINSGSTRLERDTVPFRDERRRYRTLVAPGVTGPNQQHFFAYRLDFDVDGAARNSVIEINVDRDPVSEANPDGHWFAMVERVLATEHKARRSVNAATSRSWRIVNRSRLNDLGQPTAYALLPRGNAFVAADPRAPSREKLGFVDYHLWVTPFEPAEMHAGGDFLPPGVRGGGLPFWTEKNRSVDDTDVVVWYNLGITHQVRPEDYPLMPVHTAGFSIAPFGFFTENPAMDVSPPTATDRDGGGGR